jgi:hypothetical protein
MMGFNLGSAIKDLGKNVLSSGVFGGGLEKGFTKITDKSNDYRDTAAELAAQGQQAGIDELARQFNLTREDLLPFLQGGLRAQTQIEDLLSGKADFANDPLLNQQLDLAGKQAGRFASAGGYLGGGQFSKDLLRGTSGVFDNRINQLLALRSGGQAAGQSIGSFGANTAGQTARLLGNIGNIQAAPYLSKANTIDQLLNTGLGVGLGALVG